MVAGAIGAIKKLSDLAGNADTINKFLFSSTSRVLQASGEKLFKVAGDTLKAAENKAEPSEAVILAIQTLEQAYDQYAQMSRDSRFLVDNIAGRIEGHGKACETALYIAVCYKYLDNDDLFEEWRDKAEDHIDDAIDLQSNTSKGAGAIGFHHPSAGPAVIWANNARLDEEFENKRRREKQELESNLAALTSRINRLRKSDKVVNKKVVIETFRLKQNVERDERVGLEFTVKVKISGYYQQKMWVCVFFKYPTGKPMISETTSEEYLAPDNQIALEVIVTPDSVDYVDTLDMWIPCAEFYDIATNNAIRGIAEAKVIHEDGDLLAKYATSASFNIRWKE
jgi:hypothetical protein